MRLIVEYECLEYECKSEMDMDCIIACCKPLSSVVTSKSSFDMVLIQ